jgi:hypothetical protein
MRKPATEQGVKHRRASVCLVARAVPEPSYVHAPGSPPRAPHTHGRASLYPSAEIAPMASRARHKWSTGGPSGGPAPCCDAPMQRVGIILCAGACAACPMEGECGARMEDIRAARERFKPVSTGAPGRLGRSGTADGEERARRTGPSASLAPSFPAPLTWWHRSVCQRLYTHHTASGGSVCHGSVTSNAIASRWAMAYAALWWP